MNWFLLLAIPIKFVIIIAALTVGEVLVGFVFVFVVRAVTGRE